MGLEESINFDHIHRATLNRAIEAGRLTEERAAEIMCIEDVMKRGDEIRKYVEELSLTRGQEWPEIKSGNSA